MGSSEYTLGISVWDLGGYSAFELGCIRIDDDYRTGTPDHPNIGGLATSCYISGLDGLRLPSFPISHSTPSALLDDFIRIFTIYRDGVTRHMSEDTSTPAASGEDTPMLDAPMPLSLKDALKQPSQREWEASEYGVIGHKGDCTGCANFGAHLLQAIKNGEGPNIAKVAFSTTASSGDRALFPVLDSKSWAESFVAAIPHPNIILPVSPFALITYYLNTLPASIAFRERMARPGASGDMEGDARSRQASIDAMVSLLRDLTAAQHRLRPLSLVGAYDPCSALTPRPLWDEIPRRIRGDRALMYPVLTPVNTPHGEVVCALPNRIPSAFEMDNDAFILPLSGGGHPHWIASLWSEVPYISAPRGRLVSGRLDIPFTSAADLARLYIEAMAIPYRHRSLVQRGWAYGYVLELTEQVGATAVEDMLRSARLVDMGEHTLIHGPVDEIPLSVPCSIEANVFRWDMTTMQVWAIMLYVFPECAEDVLLSMSRSRSVTIDAQGVIPPFYPTVYPSILVPTVVPALEHLVFQCGVPRAELTHFWNVAAAWGRPELEQKYKEVRLLYASMKERGIMSKVGLPPFTSLPDDIPLGEVTAATIFARYDRRQAVATSHKSLPPPRAPASAAHASSSRAPDTKRRRTIESNGDD